MKITLKPSSLIFPKLRGFDYFTLDLKENCLRGFYDDGFANGNYFQSFAISNTTRSRSTWSFDKRYGATLTDDYGLMCFKAQLNKRTVEQILEFLNGNKTLQDSA